MKPSEVRQRILDDHQTIRSMLEELEAAAQQTQRGDDAGAGALRAEAQRFLARLESHMSWEDRYLAPALREADDWGPERAERLAADHREQRETLEYALKQLGDATRPASVVADDVLALVRLLRDDMVEEEEMMLDPKVLRDDVIGIDVETG